MHLRDTLSLKLVISSLKKKYRTTFRSPINDLEEDEERDCLDEIGGRGGKKFDATIMQGNIEENLEPNLE